MSTTVDAVNSSEMKRSPIKNKSPEAVVMERILLAMSKGSELTRGQLMDATGFDWFMKPLISICWSARDRLLRASKGVWVVLAPKQGIRRLTDSEAVNRHADHRLHKASRCVHRGQRGSVSVDYDALSDSDKKHHNVGLAAFGAMRTFARQSAQKKIAANIEPQPRPDLAPYRQQVIALFGKKK